MKKLLLLLAAASVALSSSAQFKVVESGQVQVGTIASDLGYPTIVADRDSTATIRVGGNGEMRSGGRISFGSGKVYIEQPKHTISNTYDNVFRIGTGNGFSFLVNGKSILGYNPNLLTLGAGASLTSTAAISAPQFLTKSDARLKTDIESLENVSELLGNIVPISYTLVANAEGYTES